MTAKHRQNRKLGYRYKLVYIGKPFVHSVTQGVNIFLTNEPRCDAPEALRLTFLGRSNSELRTRVLDIADRYRKAGITFTRKQIKKDAMWELHVERTCKRKNLYSETFHIGRGTRY